ncbi:putative translation initiation factor and PINT domain-containing protein [Cryptosporidium canis]|uniref:Translation initiation factor and PINT domain-containing protein n=1 Tax=Cryptosporidium canis TaxID=195482 RepID=A0A9D5DI82_9CRYT|nr:putative translation initiation factor and PINT domain-containing protein [Cryptosporidium canis]
MNTINDNDTMNCDINGLVSSYMDSQMLLYLVRWFKEMKVYDLESLNSAEIDALKTTYFFDDMKEKYPQELAEELSSKDDISDKLQSLSRSLNSLIAALKKWKETHDESSRSLKRKSLVELQQWYLENDNDSSTNTSNDPNSSIEDNNDGPQLFPLNPVQMLIRLSRLFYLSGKYRESQNVLDIVLKIIPDCTNIEVPLTLRVECYFGSIANGIISNLSKCSDPIEPSSYLNYFQLVDETLSREFHKINPIQIYLYKSWLVHWSLFPLFTQYFRESSFSVNKTFSNVNGQNSAGNTQNNPSLNNNITLGSNINVNANSWGPFLDWFASEKNLQVISTICPHLIRYLACFGIIMRRNKDILDNIVNIIALNRDKYKDPFTELIFNLLVKFDFEKSQKILNSYSSVTERDFFLYPLQKYIEENAKLLIFEIYCRIHKSIDLNVISNELSMTSIEAERWIVNLIRNVHLDGKLDYENNRVEMIDRSNNPSQMVSDKTRNILFRSNLLIQNISNNPSFNYNSQKTKPNWRVLPNKQSNRVDKRE